MRNEFGPVLAVRSRGGCGEQREISAGLVRANVEQATMMVHVVLVIGLAFRDQLPIAQRFGGAQAANFGGGVAGSGQEHPFTAARPPDADAESLIALFIDERILRGAEFVTIETILAFGAVLNGVEEMPITRC